MALIGWARRLALFALFFADAVAAQSLALVTEDLPPFNMPAPDGKGVSGLATDILRAALDQAGIGYSMSVLPWPRAYKQALENEDSCVFSTARTPERESFFKWAGPLFVTEAVLYGRPDSPRIADLSEAKGRVIGGYYFDSSTDYLEQKGLTIDRSTDNGLNLPKLLAKRIDYWAAGREVVRYYAKTESARALIPILKFRDVTNYLACNRATSDQTMQRIQAALEAMKADGRAEAILASYR